MSSDLQQEVNAWLKANKTFILELTSRAHSDEERATKKQELQGLLDAQQKTISRLGMGIVKTTDHTLKPVDNDRFVVQITRWGRILAHLIYVTGQGDVTKETLDPKKFDWGKINRVPNTYMNIGRLATAHLLNRAKERGELSKLNLVPTFAAHIPDRPMDLNDENYVIVQPYLPKFQTLKQMSARDQQELIDTFDEGVLQDIYNATKAAGTFETCGNIGVVKGSAELYLADYEPTIFNYAEDFFFQNERGRERKLYDICDSFIRTGAILKKGTGRLLEKWEQIVQSDPVLLDEIRNKIGKPSIVLEYEGRATQEHKNSVQEIYEELPKSLLTILGK